MSPAEIVLMVIGILVFNVLIFAVIWIPISRRLKSMPVEMRAALDATGEKIERGPERTTYRGASADYTKVKGLGVVALTARNLVYRPILGKQIAIPLDQLVSLRQDKWFLRSYTGGRLHTILKLRSGTEVGFFFTDSSAWLAALQAVITRQEGVRSSAQ
jgi:hypothetical protein